jgi:hypothetical protein
MDVSICITRPWPGAWLRSIIVVVIFVIVLRRAPGDVIPLGLGGCLGSWLAAATFGETRALTARRA